MGAPRESIGSLLKSPKTTIYKQSSVRIRAEY